MEDRKMDEQTISALEALSCCVLVQQGGLFVWANGTARVLLGLNDTLSAALAVPVDRVMLGFIPPEPPYAGQSRSEGAGVSIQAGEAAVVDPHSRAFEGVLLGTDGRPHRVTGTTQPVQFHGKPARMVLAMERANGLSDEIRDHAAFVDELLDATPGALAITQHGRVLHVNHEFTRLFGYSAQETVGRDLNDLVSPEDRRQESEMLDEAVRENGRACLETVRRTRHGDLLDVAVLVVPVRISGEQTGYFVSYSDIGEQKKVAARLQFGALHDALTGLANRVLFLDRLSLTITRLQRRPDGNFAIMFLDLDHFKRVNDTLGHASGDELLLKIAGRLQACLRPQDTIARFGGDEFAILLDEIMAPDDATRVAERIQQSVRQPVEIGGHSVFVSASIGIALGSIDYVSAEHIMRDADFAMYRAKANGKSRYEIFDNSMHLRAAVQQQMERRLREAIEKDEFEIWYQPVFHLRSRSMESVEALLRWRHPERGYIPPSEFMRMAEDTGLIVQIGSMVLQKACHQMQKWLAERPGSSLSVSVNLSPREFSQPRMLDVVAGALAASGLPPSHLRLEITESSVSLDPDAAVVNLQRLADMGVGVALDNFGAGMASMNYLLRLPLQRVKLDRRLTGCLPAKGRQGALVETIFSLCRLMQMRMHADGVETHGQLAELERLGCHFGQGHLFASPLPPEDLGQLLAATYGHLELR